MTDANDAYTQLLGLFSHEYFHAWNVKSIKPAAFAPYDLDRENYTEQLWAFEGITSYYDDLFLARSRTIAPEAYLRLLAQSITRIQQTKGRLNKALPNPASPLGTNSTNKTKTAPTPSSAITSRARLPPCV